MRLKSLVLALAIVLVPVAAGAQSNAPTPGASSAPGGVSSPEAPVVSGPLGALTPDRDAGEVRAVQNSAMGAEGSAPTAGEVAPATLARTKADPFVGQPVPGGMGLQAQVTELGEEARWMNDKLLLPLMTAVTLFVFGLLAYAIVKFRRRPGREPARFSHNTLVEVIWTVVPVAILAGIAVPSFQLLANQYDPPKADLTVKAVGHQWYWEYQYPDAGDFSFDSVMMPEDEAAKQGYPAQLEVDNRLVVPAGATVKVLVTAVDVLHNWAVPAFWVKMDAVPGRINETWFKTDRPGVYYGQCSELCGARHAFMPIAVEVLPPAQFAAWLRAKQAENGITPGTRGTADQGSGPVNSDAPAPAAAASPAGDAAPSANATPLGAGNTGAVAGTEQVTPTATAGPGSNTSRGGSGTNDTQ